MAQKLDASMPPGLDLSGSYIIEWDAVDPTSGAPVTGVKVSDTSLLAAGSFGKGGGEESALPYLLVPGPGA